MILKNKIITLLSIMALNIPTTGILAQEKTSFTLQDVIPYLEVTTILTSFRKGCQV